jgi:signal transduction histidine kinase
MADAVPENKSDSLSVPWIDAVRFVHQLSHDLRNHLNAIELQSAYISELDGSEELKGEIKRLREMISRFSAVLQKLTGLGEVKPNLISYRASDFVEDLRKTIAHEFPKESAEIPWDIQAGDAMLNIDPQLLQQAFSEVFANAFQHDRGKGVFIAAARIEGKRFVFTLREPKARFESSTENWGREPFRTITRGHYGLGLNRVRVIMESHGGEMRAEYDPKGSTLLTTLTLPLERGG